MVLNQVLKLNKQHEIDQVLKLNKQYKILLQPYQDLLQGKLEVTNLTS